MFGGKIGFIVLAYRLTGIVPLATQIGGHGLTRVVLYNLLVPTPILGFNDARMPGSLTT